MAQTNNFKHLFWFCVGVFIVSFIAMMSLIFMDFPDANREMAANTQGFLQGSLIMSAVGFLLTGNISTINKKPSDGSKTTELNITTTEPDKPEGT